MTPAIDDDAPSNVDVMDPSHEGIRAAPAALRKRHVDAVVSLALEMNSWDMEAGERVRRLWFDRGLRDHFGSPADMVDEMSTFWWENRELIPALRSQLEAADVRIADLQRQLDPEVRRQEAIEQVCKMALILALLGCPFSREDFAFYLRVADATAAGSPIPEPSPRAQTAPMQERISTGVTEALTTVPGLCMPMPADETQAHVRDTTTRPTADLLGTG